MSIPNTRESLRSELTELGLRPGMTVMVHSALSRVGWTVGGAVTVVRALLDGLEPDGTLVMPAESPLVSDPSTWDDARVDPVWHDTIRIHLPVFDPATTPTTMGAIPEAFRTFPGTRRSHHPLVSVCAHGRHARAITAKHALEFSEGRGTPFEKLYELDGWTLLLGVGFDRCSSLHYAESLVPARRTTTSRFPIVHEGRRVWMEVSDMAFDNGVHFPVVGAQFEQLGRVRTAAVGGAVARFFPTRELVDFAEDYFSRALSDQGGS